MIVSGIPALHHSRRSRVHFKVPSLMQRAFRLPAQWAEGARGTQHACKACVCAMLYVKLGDA